MAEETTTTLMTAAAPSEGASSTAEAAAGSTSDQQQAPAETTSNAEDQPATTEAAPETAYEFSFAEGVEVDPDTLGSLKELSKELGLTQEQAQKIADLGAAQSQKWVALQEQAITEASAQWVEEVKADKEIGGDRLSENLGIAKRALDRFGTPELTRLLDESRLGNHPELIRAMYRIGKAISDDAVVPGSRSAFGSTNSLAQRLYDNSNLS
jgi:hypothetical protein